METTCTRRQALGLTAVWLAGGLRLEGQTFRENRPFRITTFAAEVTPPLRHPLMGGGIVPAQTIEDPLYVHGFVLLGEDKPIVLAAVDWCEIRNDAYTRWRTVLAEAAQTTPERVLVACVHQHDAPVADLEAQRLLQLHKAAGSICDLDFHERTVQRVGKAVRASLQIPHPVTHVGIGQARVDKVASNRRYLGIDRQPRFDRTSATQDPFIRGQPEGTIDPWLKTISFWDRDRAVVAVSCYATHPMSHYGRGAVSSDFVGLARRRRQADSSSVFQIYLSGCSGNVSAGKYNDGAAENRPELAERIYRGMTAAWSATKRLPLGQVKFRTIPLRLEPRGGPGFTVADLTRRLTSDPKPFGQCLAALGLSWRKRADAGHKIDVPVLDFGNIYLLGMPAEAYVEFQILAQNLRRDAFVMTAGYGECAPGYIPIDRAFAEKDTNLNDWCWIAPGSERAMIGTLGEALKKTNT